MNAKDLLFFFAREWKAKYGKTYPIAFAKEATIFKSLLADYTSNDLQLYIRFYLSKLNDPFASQNGHPVGILKHCLAKIIAEVSKEENALLRVKESEQDYQKLTEARKRLGDE